MNVNEYNELDNRQKLDAIKGMIRYMKSADFKEIRKAQEWHKDLHTLSMHTGARITPCGRFYTVAVTNGTVAFERFTYIEADSSVMDEHTFGRIIVKRKKLGENSAIYGEIWTLVASEYSTPQLYKTIQDEYNQIKVADHQIALTQSFIFKIAYALGLTGDSFKASCFNIKGRDQESLGYLYAIKAHLDECLALERATKKAKPAKAQGKRRL